MAKELKFSEGNITLFKQNLFFIPSDTIVKIIHNNSVEDNAYIYNISKEIGFNWFKNMIGSHGLSIREIVKWGLQTLTFSGWGKLSLKDLDEQAGYSRTLLQDSVVSKIYLNNYGVSEIPVDHIVRGLMAGGGCIIHKNPTIEMVETKCMAKGNKYCEIVAKPREFFKDKSEYISQIGKKNYDLDIKTGKLVVIN